MTRAIPVGKFGYRKIAETPFCRTWGLPASYLARFSYFIPLYFLFRSFTFFMGIFIERVVWQDRDWLYEGRKFSNVYGNFRFKDSPMSSGVNLQTDEILAEI